MEFQIIVEPRAVNDIRSIQSWYEDKQSGLGARFVDDLENKLKKVKLNPRGYQIRYKNRVRITFLSVFPVGLHFLITESNIHVIAVLGTKQDPFFWEAS